MKFSFTTKSAYFYAEISDEFTAEWEHYLPSIKVSLPLNENIGTLNRV